MCGDADARLQLAYVIPALDDDPAGLMSEHARQSDAEGIGREVDQVRSANRRRARPDPGIQPIVGG